jgi:Flp pilus assembly protein TadD
MPVHQQITALAAFVIAGCAAAPPTPEARGISAEALLEARPIVGERTPAPLRDIDILALNPEMRAFLDRVVQGNLSESLKIRRLVNAILNDESFNLEYDSRTRTAAETFQERRGNCLSFTNMFVAMARELGIDAHYQEVDVPPVWTMEGEAFVLSRHVNVLVDLGWKADKVVDFNIDEFRTSYDRRKVKDRRALAHYYNNIGVEHMNAGAAVDALRYFRKAIDKDPSLSTLWGNLGILYRRSGYLDYAEAAYLQALQVNSRDTVAMSNLAALYDLQGDRQRADSYRNRVRMHRMGNPYYRYRLGRDAFLAADYETAIGHFRYAASHKKNERAFYLLLGLSYQKLGKERQAKRWFAKAQEIAESSSPGRGTSREIERLLSISRQNRL